MAPRPSLGNPIRARIVVARCSDEPDRLQRSNPDPHGPAKEPARSVGTATSLERGVVRLGAPLDSINFLADLGVGSDTGRSRDGVDLFSSTIRFDVGPRRTKTCRRCYRLVIGCFAPLLGATSHSRCSETVLGALIGWGITHLYYVQAVNDMKADAEERRRESELLFRGIEDIGNLKYARDASGKVVGVVIELRGQASAKVTATGSLTVIDKNGVAK